MTFDEIKKLALSLLQNYENAWSRNAALEAMLDSVPMVDGTKGIPEWRKILEKNVAHPEAVRNIRAKFQPLYDKIQHAQQDSDLLELLKRVPPVGGVN